MSFDAFNPIYFAPTPMPQWNAAPSPEATYQNAVNASAINAASLQVPRTPVFLPPPVQVPQSFPSSGFGALSALALFGQPNPGAPMTLPPGQTIAPPTITVENGGLVMPPPAPQNPVTFGPPGTLPEPAPGVPMTPAQSNAFWGTFLDGL